MQQAKQLNNPLFTLKPFDLPFLLPKLSKPMVKAPQSNTLTCVFALRYVTLTHEEKDCGIKLSPWLPRPSAPRGGGLYVTSFSLTSSKMWSWAVLIYLTFPGNVFFVSKRVTWLFLRHVESCEKDVHFSILSKKYLEIIYLSINWM